MMHPSLAAWADVIDERERQAEDLGYTTAHDDAHSLQEWAWLISRRVVDLSHPWPAAHADPRGELVQIAALALAAIEALDRRELP